MIARCLRGKLFFTRGVVDRIFNSLTWLCFQSLLSLKVICCWSAGRAARFFFTIGLRVSSSLILISSNRFVWQPAHAFMFSSSVFSPSFSWAIWYASSLETLVSCVSPIPLFSSQKAGVIRSARFCSSCSSCSDSLPKKRTSSLSSS